MSRVIVAGGRTITDYALVQRAIAASGFDVGVLLSGACPTGVDALGERWARERGVEVERYPARWEEDGRGAGPMRNARMAARADCLVAVWDGKSRGTRSMISLAKQHELRVFVVRVA
jgi:hypothetical protein